MDQNAHQDLVAALRKALEQAGPGPEWEHACSYLPGQRARDFALRVEGAEPGMYHALMDLNFRRSGMIVYRPQCTGCSQCQAIRVPVLHFAPNRSQRRCWKRNADLEISVGVPELNEEKHQLYRRYLEQRHDGKMDGSFESLREFLYESPLDSREVVYRRRGRIIGVGIIDVEPEAISTVYCFYSPVDVQDGLGVFNVLWSIEHARSLGVPYVYLGYYVRDCAKMNYKLKYLPCEVLAADGSWTRIERA